jgi:hypothetical protein
MRKDQWLETVQTFMSGGTLPSDLKLRYSGAVIKNIFYLAYSEIIFDIYKGAQTSKDYGHLDNYVTVYAGTKDGIIVQKDELRGDYFFKLPCTVIPLPENNGIRAISPIGDADRRFDYVDNITENFYINLEASKLSYEPMWYLEGSNVRFKNYDPDMKELLVKILKPVSEFEDDDELGIPAEHSLDVFNMIVSILRKQPPEKKANNGTSKQI